MNAVLYIRMSTEKQDNSIASQKSVLLNYAKSHNYYVIKEYIDEGISGREAKKRPAFIQMIEDSENNLFNIILIYDTSRFARNLEEFIVYKSTLKRSGIELISVTEPNVDEDTSLITDAMLGAINEMYSRKLSKAVKRGMQFKAQQGIYQVPPPFGYIKKNDEMSIIKAEETIVKQIFDMFIEVPTYHSIAVKLNSLGITKRSNKLWSSTDIKRILKNRAYIGDVFYNHKFYKGKHKAIIDTQKFNKVQELINIKSKQRKRPENTYKHWMSGIIKCHHCGSAMNYAKDKHGNTSYRCSFNRMGKCKYSNYLSIKKLEELIVSQLIYILEAKEIKNYEYVKKESKFLNEIKYFEKVSNKTRLKLDRCKKAYIDGVDSIEEYKKNKDLINKEKIKIEEQLKNIKLLNDEQKRQNDLKNSIKYLYDLIISDDFTIEQKSIAIKSIINKVVLNKYTKNIIIYYYV